MNRLRVREIMSTNVVTIGEEDNLEIAAQAMRIGRIHHLPVIREDGTLVGLVTQGDIFRAQVSVFAELTPSEEREFRRSILVSRMMCREVRTVQPDTTALEAARIIRKNKYGCLPVVEGERLVGIVTEGDFIDLVIRALADQKLTEPPPPHVAPKNGAAHV